MDDADDTYLLPDGRRVPHHSALAKIDRAVVEDHLRHLRNRSHDQRLLYFANVERSEGREAMEHLRRIYGQDWERRKKELRG